MSRTSFGLIAVATALVAASPAYAVTPINLIPGPGGTLSAGFSKTITPAGPFSEIFTFSLPSSGLTAAAAISISVNNVSLINFTSATLNGTPLTPGSFPGGQTLSITSLATIAGTQTLVINGTSGGDGSFGGNISFAPSVVPEPGTWALLILGFGAVGSLMRRRARSAAGIRVRFA